MPKDCRNIFQQFVLRSLKYVPIHFCHGLDDKLVPFSEGKRLYDCYDGPKACYWVEAANHYDVRRRQG